MCRAPNSLRVPTHRHAAGFGGDRGRAEEATFTLDDPTRRRCLAVLEAGIVSDECWPAMHAAEALTLAGQEGVTVRENGNRGRRCG